MTCYQQVSAHDVGEDQSHGYLTDRWGSIVTTRFSECWHTIHWHGEDGTPLCEGLEDSDGDGVPDIRDKCPKTKPQTKVDEKGCELDSDNDGVVDRRDLCPGTIPNAIVDYRGCRLDADGDGVFDDLDQCPNTPINTIVNAVGCQFDDDSDGVANDLDQCPTTPLGVVVDEVGCPLDDDRDGVLNHQDQCPNTNRGAKVNRVGCAIKIVINHVQFQSDKAHLTHNYKQVLSEVADSLLMNIYRIKQIKVIGHTDSKSDDDYNMELSIRRAIAVKHYLIKSGIPEPLIKAIGKGEQQPVAKNKTAEGRLKNRRVEIHLKYENN